MIPLDEMRRRVLASVNSANTRSATLLSANGSVAAVDVTSPNDYPLFDNSAMDGYAVRSDDIEAPGTRLDVIGVSSAGHPFVGSVGVGQAVRILTGAMMVDGADCVVPVEATSTTDDVSVRIDATPGAGDHVRTKGGVVSTGDVVIRSGTELTPAHLGLLASLGIAEIEVILTPRVVILSTGDELIAPGGQPGAGQIFESNTVLLHALLSRMGCAVDVIEAAADDAAQLAALLGDLAEDHDVIISTGGVSMGGEYDALRNAVERFEVEVVQVAIKPAKPFAFGRVGDAVMFGLPGNPASVLVSFESFVRPALRSMAGKRPVGPRLISGQLGEDVERVDDGKIHFLAMARDDSDNWRVTARHGSHAISPFSAAEAMLALAPEQSHVEAGTQVELIPLWE